MGIFITIWGDSNDDVLISRNSAQYQSGSCFFYNYQRDNRINVFILNIYDTIMCQSAIGFINRFTNLLEIYRGHSTILCNVLYTTLKFDMVLISL